MTDTRPVPRDPDFEKVIGAFFEKLSKNICPHCDAPIAQQEQVGRCVYAHPCGHRLYQGTVGAFAPRVSGDAGGGEQK